jgi:hypothetical protein
LLDPLAKSAAALPVTVVEGVEYAASEFCGPIFPCAVNTKEKLLTQSDVTKGAGGPYTGDGLWNVEEPSLPEDVGKA